MNVEQYNYLVDKLRLFFKQQKGFVEIPTQSRTSILAACEEPATVATYKIGNTLWPLPQTGQMWLEYELLTNPTVPGVFCLTTSYRDEPHIIEGRHQRIFPLFEFEAKGTIAELRALETELLIFLGFAKPVSRQYEEMCEQYGVSTITAYEEEKMYAQAGQAILLEHFPHRSSPFFNMKRTGNGLYNKIDVLLCGMETIGSAERSCNAQEMREDFMTISDGMYAARLFDLFGKERVMGELDAYLELPMIPRFGGGIGMSRLARAMEHLGLFKESTTPIRHAISTAPTRAPHAPSL